MSILVIEDNEDAAEMLKMVLELGGHQVFSANTARDGLEAAANLQPELILCDLGLPGGLSGYDVARELRANPQTADIRLVALSGYARAEDKEQASRAGFDAHLSKPVDTDNLKRTIASLATSVPKPKSVPRPNDR